MTGRPAPSPRQTNSAAQPPEDPPLDDQSAAADNTGAQAVPDPEQAWKALGLVNDWIRHAETKTGATLAAAGVTGGVLYNLVKDQTHPSGWLSLVASLCGVAIVGSALCAVIALIPQLRVRKTKTTPPSASEPGDEPGPQEDPASLLFFAHITRDYKGDAPTYAQVLKTLTSDPDHLTEQIGRQVHANAHVAQRKYRWANAAIIGLAFDLALLGGTALLVSHR